MELATQLMMGVSLGACAGLRAWLPLLMASILARGGYIHLGASFSFLGRTDALMIFGVAAAVEFLGDKVIGLDHLMDGISTFIRPAAGTLLASSMITHADPLTSTVLGLIVGGGSAFTVHVGKAAVRAHSTALAPVHGGAGNAGLSLAEDAVAVGGPWLAVVAPVAAFILAILAICGSIWIVTRLVKHGARAVQWFRRRRAPSPAGVAPSPGFEPSNFRSPGDQM